MTSKIDEIIDSIPALDVNLADVLNFGDKCVDPLAAEIIAESLSYALETSVRRLESVAKINPLIREAATENILPAVKTLRDIVTQAPRCTTNVLSQAPVIEPPPKILPKPKKAEKPKAEKKAEKPKTPKKTTKKKATKPEELVENLSEAVEEAKEEAELTSEQLIAQTYKGLDPSLQKAMNIMKSQSQEIYDDLLLQVGKGELSEEKLKANIFKGLAQGSQPMQVSTGKQFTITYDGEEKKVMVVPPNLVKIQKPEEAGVEAISENSALAKALMGKKQGDAAVEIPFKGKTYKATVSEVKEGHMIPKGKELGGK